MKRYYLLFILIASCFLLNSCELFISRVFGVESITIINDTSNKLIIGNTDYRGDTLCVCFFSYHNFVDCGDTLLYLHSSSFGIDKVLKPKRDSEPPVCELVVSLFNEEMNDLIQRKPDEEYDDPNIYCIIRVTLADLEACDYTIAINEALASSPPS